MAEGEQGSMYRQMAQGYAWTFLLRWSVRGLGLISVVILARVLAPADFGVVAMATLVSGLLMRLSESGAGLLLLRETTLTSVDLDTGWTINLLQGVAVAVCLVILAPYAALYFEEPRLVLVMYALAAVPVIQGLENAGTVLFLKEAQFSKDFRFNLYTRLTTLPLTIGSALLLRSYWALVLGSILSSIARVAISFAIHPYRPRLSLKNAGKFVRFAGALMPMAVGTYLCERIPLLVGGRLGDASDAGRLQVASEISMMATEEIVTPITRVLHPGFGKIAHDPKQVREAFLNVLAATSALAFPIGVGLAAVAHDFTRVVLGPTWLGAVVLVEAFAVRGALKTVLRTLVGNILIATGHERMYLVTVWIEVAVTLAAVIVGGSRYGIEGIGAGALVAAVLIFPVSIYTAVRVLGTSWLDVPAAIVRPVLASIVMFVAVRMLHVEGLDSPLVRLVLDTLVGAAAYCVSTLGLWWLAGRPGGPERAILRFASERLLKPRPRDGSLPL